jgi:hypothetical protein
MWDRVGFPHQGCIGLRLARPCVGIGLSIAFSKKIVRTQARHITLRQQAASPAATRSPAGKPPSPNAADNFFTISLQEHDNAGCLAR